MCHVAIVTDHVYNNYVYTTFKLALITHSTIVNVLLFTQR